MHGSVSVTSCSVSSVSVSSASSEEADLNWPRVLLQEMHTYLEALTKDSRGYALTAIHCAIFPCLVIILQLVAGKQVEVEFLQALHAPRTSYQNLACLLGLLKHCFSADCKKVNTLLPNLTFGVEDCTDTLLTVYSDEPCNFWILFVTSARLLLSLFLSCSHTPFVLLLKGMFCFFAPYCKHLRRLGSRSGHLEAGTEDKNGLFSFPGSETKLKYQVSLGGAVQPNGLCHQRDRYPCWILLF